MLHNDATVAPDLYFCSGIRMLHNNAMVAPDPYLCSGIRTLHDDAVLAADRRNVPFRSFSPRTIATP